MQAFFDPSKSVYRSPDEAYNCITYIQVGQFHINFVPLPVRIHNDTSPYPVDDQSFLDDQMRISSWVDICKFSSNENRVSRPYYPLWIWQNDADFDLYKLFKYPQHYGGFTRYNGQSFSQGDNLCSYMKSHVDLRFLDIPSYIPNYFENIDLSGLIPIYQFPDELPQKPGIPFPYGLDPVNLIEELVKFKQLPSPSSNPQLHFFISRNNRYFITYNTNFIRKSTSIPEPIYVVIFPNSEGKYLIAYLPYSPYEIYEQDKQSGLGAFPDFEGINDKISIETGFKLNLQGNIFNFSYKYITYACAIKETSSNQISIKLFEGFTWWPGRQWIKGNGGFVVLNGPKSADHSDAQVFKLTINNFFRTSNITVNWA